MMIVKCMLPEEFKSSMWLCTLCGFKAESLIGTGLSIILHLPVHLLFGAVTRVTSDYGLASQVSHPVSSYCQQFCISCLLSFLMGRCSWGRNLCIIGAYNWKDKYKQVESFFFSPIIFVCISLYIFLYVFFFFY
ncbi:hypothetical protein ACOSP7_007241 [Xanthoceras sorbifolium]